MGRKLHLLLEGGRGILRMAGWIEDINPLFVSIGADSKKHNLKEPTGKKIRELIVELKKITEVRIKKNLKPLFEGEKYWYTSKIPRKCTKCGRRIKIGMTYYIPPGAGVLCSDCGQEHLEIRKKGVKYKISQSNKTIRGAI